ncbi:hypothetical protein [Williamsia sp. CHRR-6]|uniref:hypothetical protein n=1 Tax=Williamsia sp. CHRR-6 TaxID=2835871 RepID=UPI001BDA66EA|nr:hypothetical protein [Williamsia sp. CHRR-6]MBT0568592.1 hypothetical protein [Williamsia sp. CHRR-6]
MTDTTTASERGAYLPHCADTACREGHCRDCGTHTMWTAEAWGNAVDCPACGRHDFYSIGD